MQKEEKRKYLKNNSGARCKNGEILQTQPEENVGAAKIPME